MAALTKRVVVRISDELDAWIAQQAETEGLDPATWVRATLMRMRNGVIAPVMMFDETSARVNAPAAEVPSEPVDIDALVQEATAGVDPGSLPPQPNPPMPVGAGDRVTWEQLNEGAKQMLQAPNGDGGVRATFRPPLPFSQVPPVWR